MSRTREEHLTWCKNRALALADQGDLGGAIASMASDLTKWEKPIVDDFTLGVLTMNAMTFAKSAEEVRKWIEGFQ